MRAAQADAVRRGAALSLRDISKRYGAVLALNGVSLTIEPGEFFTLLGPSGSGKSTLLMVVAGFLQPSAGEVIIDDRPVTYMPPYRRDIGMVFQQYALFPHMTVFENIAFPLRMRRIREDEVRKHVRNALELVRLQGYEDRYPKQLSGGEQQRVAMARAIVFAPRLLLMDEPLGALDRKLRAQMQLELRQLHRLLGVTVVYVTHDQEEALTLSDRVAVLHAGHVEQVGTPRQLYETPATPFVADFIGESNFFTGRVVEVSSEGILVDLLHGAQVVVPAAGVVVPAAGVAPGDKVVIAVRPERVTLAENGGAPAFEGDVAEVIYLGTVIKVVLQGKGGTRAVLTAPVREQSLFGLGARIGVTWPPEAATLHRGEGGI